MAFRIETATCLTGRYDDAVEQMRLAVDLDPLSQVINANYGIFLGFAKRYEEGALQLRKTIELDGSWGLGHLWLGQNFELRGSFFEAIPHYEKAIELDSPYGLGYLGHPYAKSGRVDEARALLEHMEELAKSRYVDPVQRASIYAGLADFDGSFEWLEKACDERSGTLLFTPTNPIARDLEHDPRFPT